MAENQHKPHAVCVPWPAQGHLNPMLMLAKLLHSNGFHVTFVNTEHNRRRLLSIGCPTALDGLPDFCFAAIPDGLPPSDPRTNLASRCRSISTTCLEPFCDLLSELQATSSAPPVSCIVSDGLMSFTLQAAERFRLPEVLFLTASACGLLGYTQLRLLVEKGYIPLQVCRRKGMKDSMAKTQCKPHAVCVPFPAQGHVNPMLMLAKLLHSNGFYITFVNTEFSHRRLLKGGGSSALDGLPDFRFAVIPDGLSLSDPARSDLASLCHSTTTTCLEPFCDLLSELNSSGGDVPPVSCVVSDGVMSFTLAAVERFRLPEVLFWTPSACGFLGYTQYRKLVEKGYTPLQDMKQVRNGYLERSIDWIPGMKKMRLKDLPTFIRTTDAKDTMLNFMIQETDAVPKAKAVILNTFDELEQEVLSALSAMFPRIFTLGPLHLMTNHIHDQGLKSMNLSLWNEDHECIKWLDTREPGSVIYVNFGSLVVMTAQQLTELAWGLAGSKKPFLWIMRPGVVERDAEKQLPPEFLDETKDRSLMIGWCPQERVLAHNAIGGFLTHCGWNSTLESITNGVPMMCCPFFAEQQANCRFSCGEWDIGMEIDSDVKRGDVEVVVREMMDGEKGKKIKDRAMQWKKKAEEATSIGGSSYLNLDKLIKEELLLYFS